MFNKRTRDLFDRTEELLNQCEEPTTLFEKDVSPEVIERYQLAVNHMREASALFLYCTVEKLR